jgi:hypothetical protein
MVEADFSGDYVNADNTNEGDILTIVGEADYATITHRASGKTKDVLNIPVENNGKKKIYTPSMETGKMLIKTFGKETKEWVGKKLQAHIVNYKAFGVTKKAVDCTPL